MFFKSLCIFQMLLDITIMLLFGKPTNNMVCIEVNKLH